MVIFTDKNELRMTVREARIQLDKVEKEQADHKIESKVFGLKEYQDAETIFIFVSRLDEVRTVGIIEQAIHDGKNIVIPRVKGPMRLTLHYFMGWEQLEKNKMNILEPKADAPKATLDVIDCAIIPALACSKTCDRLGYGGGYYDYILKNSEFSKICLCYEQFIFDRIPTRSFDVQMDKVVSETNIYQSEKVGKDK